MNYDVLVIGGGAAGLGAAREVKRLGGSVVIINDGPLGGDCTFTGCVPSKTLLESAHAGRSFSEAFDRTQEVVARIAASEDFDVLRNEGIEIVDGQGNLRSKSTVEVNGKVFHANKGIVLALGSKPALPPIQGLKEVDFFTTDTFWSLSSLPKSVVLLGGGPIGCELGQALHLLGSQATIVEGAGRLLEREEPAASKAIHKTFVDQKLPFHTGSFAKQVQQSNDGVEVVLENGSVVAGEKLLVVAGRKPNTTGALREVGILLDDRGYIETNDALQTSLDGVYAVGDVTGKMPFTHAADHMGRLAAGTSMNRFKKGKFKPQHIGWVTFTQPEIARIGMTEAQAVMTYSNAMVAELPLTEHDRALAAGKTNGFIKLIAGPRKVLGMAGGGKLIGATIVAPRAGEMIAELALAIRVGAFVGRLAQTVHPYPTWSYGIAKAAGQFFTEIEGRKARPVSQNFDAQ